MQPKNESTKYIIGIIVILLVILAVTLGNRDKSTPSEESAVTEETELSAYKLSEAVKIVPVAEEKAEAKEPKKATLAVEYTDENGFTPDTLSVKVGDTVTFVNKSVGKMWVGTDLHPTHMEYDGTSLKDHCAAGAKASFDQCAAAAEYSFTFTKVGTFNYHNHARATMRGTVVVK